MILQTPFIVNLKQILLLLSLFYNALLTWLLMFIQFYFIYVIKCIILSAHPANDFSQSAIREKIDSARTNAHPVHLGRLNSQC